ncbi:MAG: LacI family DNA-binding transcriptional regulator [Armatimonadaceae bacterium]
MASFRKTTLRDVAQRAGVSTTTVSEYLSGRPYACSMETASRIQKAVEDLHYIPNALGASLRKSATRTIGLSLLFPLSGNVRQSGFLLRLWEGITQEAFQEQHSVLFYEDSIRMDVENYRTFLDGRVDGVVFQPIARDHRPRRLAEAGLPVATISTFAEVYPGCINVISDEREIVGLVMEHLWQLGHRRIAHFAGPISAENEAGTPVAAARCAAYRAFCEERGIYDPALVFESDLWRVSEFTIIDRWYNMPNRPTAIFCVTDAMAVEILAHARSLGWRVPQELSVVGVDNTLFGELHHPALTSVEYPVEEQGRVAIRSLMARIQGKPAPLETVWIRGAELVVRETTAPPPGD